MERCTTWYRAGAYTPGDYETAAYETAKAADEKLEEAASCDPVKVEGCSFSTIPCGYKFHPGKTSASSTDLIYDAAVSSSIADLAKECNENTSCGGFDTTGFLKAKAIKLIEKSTSDGCAGIFVKESAVTGSA